MLGLLRRPLHLDGCLQCLASWDYYLWNNDVVTTPETDYIKVTNPTQKSDMQMTGNNLSRAPGISDPSSELECTTSYGQLGRPTSGMTNIIPQDWDIASRQMKTY